MFHQQRILLGLSGSIAAYKSADLARRLRQAGAEVRVVMTPAACAFITPLTMQAVSGQPVHTALLDPAQESAFGHIDLARWAERILIAPASADFLAKLAHGRADDLLSALCLASAAPLLVAPAMNRQMWAAPATQANCALLRQRGVEFLGPAQGAQACGETGEGRMLEPRQLLEALLAHGVPGALSGRRVLVTAGPTREDIDPVRFISNRSSGKMGYAVAQAAREAGATVTLVSGPVCLEPPPGVEVVGVYSAQDMLEAVLARVAEADVFIAAAAVADYRPAQVAGQKLKKHAAELRLSLARTTDILAQVAALPEPPFTVGFAAETRDLEHYARDKLTRKKLDMVAANLVGLPGQGFDSEENALELCWPGGGCSLERAPKRELAGKLVARVAARMAAKSAGSPMD